MPIFRGALKNTTEPTHEDVEKVGKQFSTALKEIDEKYLAVPKIDNYKLTEYAHKFIKVYESFKKSLDPPPPSKDDKKKKKKDEPKKSLVYVDDDQQKQYEEMMKHV